MPTYEYRCQSGHDFEQFYRKISDAPGDVSCPECGVAATRKISAGAGLLFKGSGFYITDYGKDGKKPQGGEGAGRAEGAAEKGAGADKEGGGGAAATEKGGGGREGGSVERRTEGGGGEGASGASRESGNTASGEAGKSSGKSGGASRGSSGGAGGGSRDSTAAPAGGSGPKARNKPSGD